MLSSAPVALNAQQRTWTANNGTSTFRAELVNAYGSTVYFHKEDDGFIHLPITFLAPYDIARVLDWANKRDAQPQGIMMNSSGLVTKAVCKQWPNRIIGDRTNEDEDINNLVEPRIYAILTIRKETYDLIDRVSALSAADADVTAADPKFMETLVLTSRKENELKAIRYILAKHGGEWLMPNEWQYKDNKELWNDYWRLPDVNVIVLDPQGNILCDGSGKEADGSPSNPVAFINEMAVIAKRMSAGGPSVPNPIINMDAVDKLINGLIEQKKDNPGPAPIIMDLSGIDPETTKKMEGKSFQVTMVINAKGRVESLTMKTGGDADDEEALRRASTLWQFVPTIKDGVPEIKTVVAPIRVKAPKPAAEAK
jgi:hypothetical protein